MTDTATETRDAWLAELRAGDEVIVWGRTPLTYGYTCRAVERTTATRIVVDGVAYSREGGYAIGNRGNAYLLEPTNDTRSRAELFSHVGQDVLAFIALLTPEECREVSFLIEGAKARRKAWINAK